MGNPQDVKITVYWLNESRGQNIVWLLEALGLSYELQTFKRTAEYLAPAELRQIHPLGHSPVVTVEQPGRRRLVLAESGNIAEYLAERFGGWERGLVPPRWAVDAEGKETDEETEAWRRYRYFMYYVEGSLMPNMVLSLILQRVRNPPGVPFFIRPIPRLVAKGIQTGFLDKQFAVHLPFLESSLATAPASTATTAPATLEPAAPGPSAGGLVFRDRLTVPDILISFGLVSAIEASAIPPDQYPELAAFANRVRADPAYRRGVERTASAGKAFVPKTAMM